MIIMQNYKTKNRAVFFDRDGVLIRHVHHLINIEQVELIPGAVETLKSLKSELFLSIIATNQSVISRGMLTVDGLSNIHAHLNNILSSEGAYLDDIFHCPHHPNDFGPNSIKSLVTDCKCRKPNTGMLETAIEKYDIDRNGSWMVGDSTTDIEAGAAAGLKTILVKTGYGGQNAVSKITPNAIIDSVANIPEVVLSRQ
jgi:mannose-1-phosphate guanylyltransferase/phosphomannomutase